MIVSLLLLSSAHNLISQNCDIVNIGKKRRNLFTGSVKLCEQTLGAASRASAKKLHRTMGADAAESYRCIETTRTNPVRGTNPPPLEFSTTATSAPFKDFHAFQSWVYMQILFNQARTRSFNNIIHN